MPPEPISRSASRTFQNLQPLPEYTTLDVGASLVMNNGLEIRFTGANVTNTLGITEGNSRVVGSGVDTGASSRAVLCSGRTIRSA